MRNNYCPQIGRFIVSMGLLLMMSACDLKNTKPSNVSLPTPFGPIVIGLTSSNEVESKKDLKPPSNLVNYPDLEKQYRTFSDLNFALWVPADCVFVRGRHFELRPEYSDTLRKEIERKIKEQKARFENLAVDMQMTIELLNSPAIQYTCGKNVIFKVATGAKINGWPISESAKDEMVRTGEDKIDLPRQQVMVTIFDKKTKIDIPITPPNLFLWSRRLDMAVHVYSIYGDGDKNRLYARYRSSYENGNVGERAGSTIVVEGLLSFFESQDFIYVMDISALQGYTTDEDWKSMRRVLDSFRFVKSAAP